MYRFIHRSRGVTSSSIAISFLMSSSIATIIAMSSIIRIRFVVILSISISFESIFIIDF